MLLTHHSVLHLPELVVTHHTTIIGTSCHRSAVPPSPHDNLTQFIHLHSPLSHSHLHSPLSLLHSPLSHSHLHSPLSHSQVHIMFHQPHPGVTRPALLVVVPDNILVVGVRVHRQVPLDEVPCLFRCEPAGQGATRGSSVQQ